MNVRKPGVNDCSDVRPRMGRTRAVHPSQQLTYLLAYGLCSSGQIVFSSGYLILEAFVLSSNPGFSCHDEPMYAAYINLVERPAIGTSELSRKQYSVAMSKYLHYFWVSSYTLPKCVSREEIGTGGICADYFASFIKRDRNPFDRITLEDKPYVESQLYFTLDIGKIILKRCSRRRLMLPNSEER